MEMLQYFLTCYFNSNENFDDLDNLINEFKKETDAQQLKFIKELEQIIQTKNYTLASEIIKKYGHRIFDEKKTKQFINFLYDQLMDR